MKDIFISLRSLFLTILITYNLVVITAGDNGKKSVDDNRDDGDSEESFDIAVPENDSGNVTCSRRANSIMHEITTAKPKQFPFMAAVMSHQNAYLCSGSVVSNGIILTTAQCTQQPVSYVLLNATKDKKDETTAELHVIKTERFPTFEGGPSLKDVGLIYTEKFNSSVASIIKLSNYTQSKNVIDMEGIGFGLNAAVGQPKELQYVGLEQGLDNDFDIITGIFDCVATKVLTCYKDTGGPIIFNNELIGIAVKGQDECTKEMSGTYAVSKRMVDVLPTFIFKAWLDEKISKNEEQQSPSLPVYPVRPITREKVDKHKMTSRTNTGTETIPVVFMYYMLSLIVTQQMF